MMRLAFAIALIACAAHVRADENVKLPDLTVINQDGQQVRFSSELIKDKIAVINSIFTTCTTICPPMGANYAHLETLLGDRLGRDVVLVSISVDPVNDTPERLKAWSAKFHAVPGWSLVTGPKPEIDHLLKSLGLFAPDPRSHAPTVLIGSETTGWTRASALAGPEKLLKIVEDFGPRKSESSAAATYFSDVILIDQDGRSQRFFTDLLKGKVVVIDAFFTACKDSCPMMARNFVHLQNWLGGRLGKEVNLLSISVDPENDTPARLKTYAEQFGARPGWYFLTGNKENVEFALRRLGEYVEQRDDHLNVFLIGNEPAQLWKKVLGLAKPEQIVTALDSVLKNEK
jgi:protein SCO1/2